MAVDTVPPQITVPDNISTPVEAGQTFAHVNFSVTATDNSGTANVVCTPSSGSAFNIGTTTVNCTATESSGNSTNASFTVTVQGAPNIVVEQPAGRSQASGSGSLNFGTIPVGSSSAVKAFVVRNTGSASLTNVAATKDGANATEFTLLTLPANTVVTGFNTAFSVQFTPSGSGSRSANLHLSSSDPNHNPFNVALTGQGTISSSPIIQTSDGGFGFNNGQFGFNLSALPGSNVVVSVSTDLLNWAPAATNQLPGGFLNFTDILATNYSKRFYRAVYVP